MVEFAGYMMPVQYEGIIAEHLWTREHAGLFDVSHMGQLFLSGEGVEPAIEAVLPIDLTTLKRYAPRYSLLLDENGGVLDDLMVTRWDTGFYLVVNGATKWDDIAHLREHLPDAVTLNHLEDSALLALQGPQAFAALERVTKGEIPLGELTFMKGGTFAIGGVEAWISRSGYTGEDGFEISIPAESAVQIADLLCFAASSETYRSWRARFLAARGRPAALRARSVARDHAGRGRPRFRNQQAQASGRRISRCGTHPRAAGGRTAAPACRPCARRPHGRAGRGRSSVRQMKWLES